MTTRIRIDPNVRVRGNMTYADIDDDVIGGDIPAIGDPVEVFEDEAGLVGTARVREVNYVTNLVYLKVNWESLRPSARVEHPAEEATP